MKTLISLLLAMTLAAAGPMRGYDNPVIKGFHPDPSVCAVGDDYYLVNSSFQYFPGVPIYHSKDLVNWEQIGHVLTRRSQLELDNALSWRGIYAPTIRYHEGMFYMITTNCSGKGNFIVHSTDPAGEWSDPAWVDMGGIDPSLFFHDGKCWYTGTADSRIMLFEIDPMTGKKLSKEKEIWRGTGGRYPEGPHLYFKDGWYYLLIAEGGTEYAHMITIARSRNIDGPYEGNPGNPILTHCKMSTQGSQIQGLGHGDFVQAADGSWWMACLGFRRQGGDHHLLGRETFMAPVEWDKDGWPVVNGNGELQLRMDVPTLPQVECRKAPSHMDFSKDRTGDEWIYLRNPFMENYSFTGTSMRLTSNGKDLDETHVSPTFTGRRQEDIFFSAITSLTAEAEAEAGLTVFMDVGSHYDIFIEDGVVKVRYRLGEMTHLIKAKEGIGSGKVWLKVEGNEYNYVFSFSTDGLEYKRLCQMNTRYLSSETASGFTGIVLGLYATGQSGKHADFYTFDYSMIPR